MKKRVKITAVGYYEIDEEAIQAGSYGDEIQKLHEQGSVSQAFDMAMAFDSSNISDGEFRPEEVLGEGDWENFRFEWTTEEPKPQPEPYKAFEKEVQE